MTERDAVDEVLEEVETSVLRERLAGKLALDKVGRSVVRVFVHGRGGRAHVRIDLDNEKRIVFDPWGSYSSPSKMSFEVTSQAGAKPKLKTEDVQEIAALVFALGQHYDASTTADRAWELGAEYLREAALVDVDMSDQASRWRAFQYLDSKDGKRVRNAVLHDQKTGSRYVRTQWFMEFLRGRCDVGEASEMRAELEREEGGWRRSGRDGRIKATPPKLGQPLQWAFLIVPKDWEQQ